MTPTTRPTMDELLPTDMPGHWVSGEGWHMAKDYIGKARGDLAGGDRTDMQVAFDIAMLMRSDSDFEPRIAMAKDRIRWLSAQLAAAMSRTTHAGEGMVEAGNFVRCPRCLQRERPDQCTVIAPQWPDRAGVAALSPSKPVPVSSPQPDRESERWFPICVTAGEILKDGRVGIKFVWPEEIGTKAPSVTAKANGPNYAIRRLSHSLTEADNG